MANDSVGSLVIKMMFETNAAQTMGTITNESTKADKSVTSLNATAKELTVVVNQADPAIQKIVQTLQEKSQAANNLKQSLRSVQETTEKTVTTFKEIDESGKDFTVTINRAKLETEGMTGATGQATQANEAHRRAIQQETQAQAQSAKVTEQASEVETAATRKTTSAYGEELGMIERLQIAKDDLIKARGLIPESDIQKIQELNAELAQVDRQLNELQGKGLKNTRKDFQDTAFQINRMHQVLFALSFLMNNFSGDNTNEETQKVSRALSSGTSTALGMTFAMQALGGTLAAFAGPIGITLGALAAIISLISKSDEVAQKASQEGLKQFAEMLEFITTKGRVDVKINLEEQLRIINSLLDESAVKLARVTSAQFSGEDLLTPGAVTQEQVDLAFKDVSLTESKKKILKEMKDDLQKQIDTQELLEVISQQVTTVTQEQLTALGAINAQLAIRNEELKTGIDFYTKEALTQEEITARVEEVGVLTKQRNDSLRTVIESNNEIIAQERMRLELGQSSLESLITKIQKAKEGITDEKQLLEYDQQIQVLIERRIALHITQAEIGERSLEMVKEELQSLLLTNITEERRVAIKSQLIDLANKEVAAQNAALDAIRRAEIETSTSAGEKRRLTEEKRHQERLTEINKIYEEEVKRSGDIEQAELHRQQLFKLEAENQNKIETDYIEKKRLAELGLQLSITQAHVQNIANIKIRQEEEEKVRHTIRLQTIDKEYQAALDAGVSLQDAREARRQAIDEEDIQHANKMAEIERKHVEAIQDLKIIGISDEAKRVEKFYDLQEQRVKQQLERGEIDAVESAILIANIQVEKQKQLSAMQKDTLDQISSAADNIGNALHRAFKEGGDEGIQKMLAMLQIAVQMAQIFKGMNSGAVGEIEGIGGLFAGLLSVVGLFNEGGQIDAGSFVINEQMSNRYKEVLDALGAKEVTGGIPHRDSVMMAPVNGKIPVLTPKERILGPQHAHIGRLINEGKLPEDMASLIAGKGVKIIFVDRESGGRKATSTEMGSIMASLNKEFTTNMTYRQSGGPIGNMLMSANAEYLRSQYVSQTIMNNNPSTVNAMTQTQNEPLLAEIQSLNSRISQVVKAVEGIELRFPEKLSAELRNGEIWLRDGLPKAQEFQKNKQS